MKPQLNAESVFVVSGGGKGITARCVVALAKRYHAHFVLLGRSELTPEPAWAQGVTDEPSLKRQAMAAMVAEGQKPKPVAVNRAVRQVRSSREIRRTLAEVAAAGGRADYVSVDVRDGEAVREALARYRAQVTAIIHGAGLLADKPIARKSEEDFEKVYGVKVDGFRNLLAAVDESRLQAVVFFASVAGFYGNVGQADYALANAVLDRAAHVLARRWPHARVLAVDWGPWDGGMVTPTLKKMLKARGVPLISLDGGTDALITALDAPEMPPQVVAGGEMVSPVAPPSVGRTYHVSRRLTLEANPYLRDHVIGGKAVLPTVCAAQWMINAAEQVAPAYRFFRIDDYRVFKGIVFDETLAERYTLDLTVEEASEEQCRMSAKVRSDLPDGKPRYHYGSALTLRRSLPDAPSFAAEQPATDFTPLPGACLYPHNGETACPPTDRPLPLFHGPAFRGVEEVLAFTSQSLTLRCRLPEVSRAAQGQAAIQTFNPFITDVTLQSLLIWANLTYGYGGLPLRIAAAELFRPLRFGEEMFAVMEVVSASAQRLVADVTVHDGRGVMLSRILGAEITLSPRLNELFRQHHLAEGRADA